MFENRDLAHAKQYDVRLHDIGHLTDYFRLAEFQCSDGTPTLLLHDALVTLLDDLRSHTGRPVTVNSGFRTGAYNKKIGGAPNSKHLLGMAADITVQGYRPREVRRIIQERYNPGGLGLYDTFVHVDVFGAGRRWDET